MKNLKTVVKLVEAEAKKLEENQVNFRAGDFDVLNMKCQNIYLIDDYHLNKVFLKNDEDSNTFNFENKTYFHFNLKEGGDFIINNLKLNSFKVDSIDIYQLENNDVIIKLNSVQSFNKIDCYEKNTNVIKGSFYVSNCHFLENYILNK